MSKSSPLPWLEDVIRDIGSYQRNSRESTNLSNSQLKGRVDLVTEVDHESERRLVESIKNHHPDDGILAEEELRDETSNTRQWIIDPLDGTTNYVQSHPFYGISVALLEDGKLIHAMTYFPEMNELFWASRGQGAYKNGSQLSVSASDQPMDAFLATGFADLRSEEGNKRYNLTVFPDLLERVQGIRRGGSAVHDLCLLAEGVFDGFWEFNLSPWDVAAGALIIREAGGTVSDMLGDDQWLHGRNIVASNGHLQTELLNWIQPHLPEDFPDGLAT